MSVRKYPFLSGPTLLVAALLPVVSGCATRPGQTDTPEAPRGIIVGESGYQTVKVTGSHIPVVVPTSPTARPLPSALRVRTMSPAEFDRLVMRGQR